MNKITAEWVHKNAEFFCFAGYRFAIYKYHDLYITINERDGEILSYEVKE